MTLRRVARSSQDPARPVFHHDAESIQEWLVERIAMNLEVPTDAVSIDTPFYELGLVSVDAEILVGELEEWLGDQLSTTILWSYPTIEELARHLSGSDEEPPVETASVPEQAGECVRQPIAIVGVGCRFPKAEGPDQLWRLLCDGVDAITEIPRQRWDSDLFYDPDPEVPGTMVTKWGGFLDAVDGFDPHFFGISPREAARIDPQQRLVMEIVWEALEDAGQPAERIAGTDVGVFMGCSTFDYSRMLLADPRSIDAYVGTGCAMSIIANRISYLLDLRGPSLTVDTACSSSLVSVYLACSSLWRNEAAMALAGGVNLLLAPDISINFSKAGVMAPDGRCKTFDARANGYVRGEGCGVVVLKPLDRALADGDAIYAVIRGGAINQDGRTNGLMAPNRLSQEAVLRAAYRNAGVSPSDVGFVEAHGTGTLLGDPIEVDALASVIGSGRADGSPCRIGSIKTNIGHLEAAAGVAGLIKAALALKHASIPPNLHFNEPNPHIQLEESGLEVPVVPCTWPVDSTPRRAGVSSFGFGGTNAHLVLEEAPSRQQTIRQADAQAGPSLRMLPISARCDDALHEVMARYVDLLRGHGEGHLDDICTAAAKRRSHHEHRAVVLGSRPEQMAECIEERISTGAAAGVVCGRASASSRPKVVFVFPGQGSQWLGMGRQLLTENEVFAEALAECDAALSSWVEWSLLEVLASDDDAWLERVDIIQPALFSIQVGLARLWRHLGVEADAVVGQSLGEVAAAHVAGALDLEDAARVIARRSQIVRETAGAGGMAMVDLPFDEALQSLGSEAELVSVAACNGPRSCLLSGEVEALDRVLERLDAADVFCRRVKVDYASHSPQMDPLLDRLREELAGIEPHPGTIRFISTVERGELGGEKLGADYWARNLREPVRLWDVVQRLVRDGRDTFLELSPHPVLLPAIADGVRSIGHECAVLASMHREQDELECLMTTLAELYVRGVDVAWSSLVGDGPQEWTTLPTYPWQRERCWFEGLPGAATAPRAPLAALAEHGRVLRPALEQGVAYWELDLRTSTLPYLADHRLGGSIAIPAAVFVEMALAAATALSGTAACRLERLEIREALILPEDEGCTVQVAISQPASDLDAGQSYRSTVRIFSCRDQSLGWVEHATAEVAHQGPAREDELPDPVATEASLQAAAERCRDEISPEEHYQALSRRGLGFGPSFQVVKRLARGPNEALGTIAARRCSPKTAIGMHPATLDGAFQVVAAASHGVVSDQDESSMFVLVGIESLEVVHQDGSVAGGDLVSHVRLDEASGSSNVVRGEATVRNEQGRVLLIARGLELRRVSGLVAAQAGDPLESWLLKLSWDVAEPREVPTRSEAESKHQPETWLVMADRGGVAEEFVDELHAEGYRCVIATVGDAYRRTGPERYELRPSCIEDFDRLLAEVLSERHPRCTGIVHAWSLDMRDPQDAGRGSLVEDQELGCISVLRLVQAWARAGRRDAPRLSLLTRGAQAVAAVGGTPDKVSVAQAPLWGFARGIMHEHPELGCRIIDLAPQPGEHEVERLLAELLAGDREDMVALRGCTRLAGRLSPADLPQAPVDQEVAGDAREGSYRSDRTYLITGGLGGVGIALAEHIVERGARHVALIGRRPPGDEARAVLDRLQETGAEIQTFATDVAEPEQVAGMLREVRRTMPPIAGVVHGAAVLEDGTVLHLEPESFAKVMAPKALGAWNLHQLTQSDPLELFVLLSSASALVGSPGASNYSAANAFLDALAHERHRLGLPALSVNWGPWSDIGFAVSPGGARLGMRGVVSIPLEVGLAAFDRLIGSGVAQAAVLQLRMRQWRQYYPRVASAPLLERLAIDDSSTDGAAAVIRSQLEETDAEDRCSVLGEHIIEEVSQVLKVPAARISHDAPLSSLGLDSLMAIELRNRLEQSLGLVLPGTLVWSYPTVERLSPRLLELIGLAPGPAVPDDENSTVSTLAGQTVRVELDDESLDCMQTDDLAELLERELAEVGDRRFR